MENNSGVYVPPAIPENTRWPLHTNALTVNWEAAGSKWPEVDFTVSQYPVSAPLLEATLAERFGLKPEQVLVTAGADQSIQLLSLVAFYQGKTRGGTLVFPEPSFSVFPLQARVFEGEVVGVPWTPGTAFPREAVLKAIDAQTRLVTLVSPNNPTGDAMTADDVEAVAKRASVAAPEAVVVVDCLYGDYADVDLTNFGLKFENVIVLRSFSKLGFAGDRVGYAMGSVERINKLRRFSLPYPVAETSLRRALWACNEGKERVTSLIAESKNQREQLFKLLTELGGNPIKSSANFILCRFADPDWVYRALSALGILVRAYPKDPQLAPYLRITCPGNKAAFAELCQSLKTVLKPEALLYDMDGVLADVSQSYRQAIIQTVQAFGVPCTNEDVAKTKTEPDSNNDWKVSLRLIERGGVKATLEDVTAKFEELYQGTPGKPGFKTTEKLLPPFELLERLSKRMPLGIVTGRPRSDALEFLQSTGIDQFFSAMVCMGEAKKSKPAPDPMLLCMEKLGVKSAWTIGDTPDDICSAMAAGVVPVGVVAPGGNSADALNKAGAARIISTTESELEALLA